MLVVTMPTSKSGSRKLCSSLDAMRRPKRMPVFYKPKRRTENSIVVECTNLFCFPEDLFLPGIFDFLSSMPVFVSKL